MKNSDHGMERNERLFWHNPPRFGHFYQTKTQGPGLRHSHVRFVGMLIQSHLDTSRGAVEAAIAEAKEGLVVLFVRSIDAKDVSTDEKPFGRYMVPDLFVPTAHRPHVDLAGGQIDLDIEDSFVTDEVFFLEADRRNEKAQARPADVGRLAKDAGGTRLFASGFAVDLGVEPDLDGRVVRAAQRYHALGQSAVKPGYQLTYHQLKRPEYDDRKLNV